MYRAVITEKKAFCATAIFIVKGMKDGYFHQPNASPGSHPSTKTGSAGNIDQQAQGKNAPHAPMIRVNSSAPLSRQSSVVVHAHTMSSQGETYALILPDGSIFCLNSSITQ